VRPTLARVRSSLFDILETRGLLEGARILDLFAGSGALGIEALSRGAESVVFVEQDRHTAKVLRSNLAGIGFEERSSVMVQSCAHVLTRLARRRDSFDGVFVDPPYDTAWADRMLRELSPGPVLNPGGWVVVHHREGGGPADRYESLVVCQRRRIADAVTVLYQRESEWKGGDRYPAGNGEMSETPQ
jgi:16S rRNA (guanine(966)-N(2))-methyltransferase RsmD